MLVASGSHFASATAAARLAKRLGRRFQAIPVDTPLGDMVARLDRFQPAIVAPYAGIAAVLAGEQGAGRLSISPVLVVLSAEGLPLPAYDRIAKALGAKVRHSYAATECPFLSFSCEHNWLHVNADWALVEPVDAEYRPTPPGEPSHTVLITNLANRVQPILRYDLGDSVVQRPDPCPCGTTLPAIRVEGRAADVLTFPTADGVATSIPPMAFVTLAERVPGIEQVQIVQSEPTTVRVRLRVTPGADPEGVSKALSGRIERLLADHNLGNVEVIRDEEPPQQTSGGKFREVIPLA